MLSNVFKILGVSLIVLLICSINRNCTESYKYRKVLSTPVQIDSLQLQDSVKKFIKSINMSHPDIVYAQAVLESNHFKSDIFKSNNNMFGMKEPMIRNTVAIGTKNGYAYYKNWEHSIIDYALYQATYLSNTSKGLNKQEYLERLVSSSYAEDPNYIKKLIELSKEF